MPSHNILHTVRLEDEPSNATGATDGLNHGVTQGQGRGHDQTSGQHNSSRLRGPVMPGTGRGARETFKGGLKDGHKRSFSFKHQKDAKSLKSAITSAGPVNAHKAVPTSMTKKTKSRHHKRGFSGPGSSPSMAHAHASASSQSTVPVRHVAHSDAVEKSSSARKSSDDIDSDLQPGTLRPWKTKNRFVAHALLEHVCTQRLV